MYHCHVTSIGDLEATEGRALTSYDYDGFLVIGNEHNSPETFTSLHSYLEKKPKLFIFVKEARPLSGRRTLHRIHRQQEKKSLSRKILKFFKRQWHCPFLETSSLEVGLPCDTSEARQRFCRN